MKHHAPLQAIEYELIYSRSCKECSQLLACQVNGRGMHLRRAHIQAPDKPLHSKYAREKNELKLYEFCGLVIDVT